MTKLMISLPNQLKEKIDFRAQEQGRSRSEIIREALYKYIIDHRIIIETPEERKKRLETIFRKWRRMGNKYNITGLTEIVIKERERRARQKI